MFRCMRREGRQQQCGHLDEAHHQIPLHAVGAARQPGKDGKQRDGMGFVLGKALMLPNDKSSPIKPSAGKGAAGSTRGH